MKSLDTQNMSYVHQIPQAKNVTFYILFNFMILPIYLLLVSTS